MLAGGRARSSTLLTNSQPPGALLRTERVNRLLARVNYFREVFAYGSNEGTPSAPAVASLLEHQGLADAARRVFGEDRCAIVEPYMVFANLLLPGQELGVHTDVPQFRGAERLRVPQWLLVVMHHSGLFEDRRLRIATGVSWYRDSSGGGAFVFYPRGPWAPPVRHEIGFNTAVVVDTDTVMHGVDTVLAASGNAPPLPPFERGMRLERRPTCAGDGEVAGSTNTTGGCSTAAPDPDAREWQLVAPDGRTLGTYAWHDMRFSVSWKAYCFVDEAEREAWRASESAEEALPLESILHTLLVDLVERGRLPRPKAAVDQDLADLSVDTLAGGLPAKDIAQLLVSEFIFFPRAPRSHSWPWPAVHAAGIFNWCTVMEVVPPAVGTLLEHLGC